MTESQLELARWLAGSEAWRGWCEAHPAAPLPVVTVVDGGRSAVRADDFTVLEHWHGYCVPDITSPLMVGPLIEMLRAAGADPWIEEGPRWCVSEWHCDAKGDTTDAEALCALLREVTG